MGKLTNPHSILRVRIADLKEANVFYSGFIKGWYPNATEAYAIQKVEGAKKRVTDQIERMVKPD